MVTCRISSSNTSEYSSLRTGQIPVSLDCRCWSFKSSCSWSAITSRRVEGVPDTYCTQVLPSSSHRRGGSTEFKMSPVASPLADTGGSWKRAGKKWKKRARDTTIGVLIFLWAAHIIILSIFLHNVGIKLNACTGRRACNANTSHRNCRWAHKHGVTRVQTEQWQWSE